MYKKYVEVYAVYLKNGELIPKRVIWEDGRSFGIDRIIDKRNAASIIAGGAGIRYTCRIRGKTRAIFLEEKRWFVEQKNN